MQYQRTIDRVIDLTDPTRNVLYNMTLDEARARVASGDAAAVGEIDGQFALMGTSGQNVLLARSISRPLRFLSRSAPKGHASSRRIASTRSISGCRGRDSPSSSTRATRAWCRRTTS